jgi:hypothetical protein
MLAATSSPLLAAPSSVPNAIVAPSLLHVACFQRRHLLLNLCHVWRHLGQILFKFAQISFKFGWFDWPT